MQKHLSLINERKCVLKWYLDVMSGLSGLAALVVEGNMVFELQPKGIIFGELHIIHLAFFSKHLKDVLWLETSESVVE